MDIKQRIDPETGSQIFEYWRGNELVGIVQGSVHGNALEVESVWVQPGFRRDGIGSTLLGNLLDSAATKGASEVQLEFKPEPNSDPEGARKLYQKFGLQEGEDGLFRGRLERK